MTTFSCAILGGGRSSRMGRDKAALMAREVAERLTVVSDDVFAVAKSPVEGLRTTIDALDATSPLVGVLTALRCARHDVVFVCACDMPLVDVGLVVSLATSLGPHDAVIPIRDGRPEPLHAVWSKCAERPVAEALAAGERAVHRVLATLDTFTVAFPPDHPSFTNINTPDDLARLRRPGRSDVPVRR